MARRSRVNPAGAIGPLLTAWYGRGHRDLPWRRTRDPYRIWVSEIMLQQTRAQAVIPYYDKFLERFPTVEALAEAAEDDVLTRWAGLSYYSRARNLRKSAQQIAAEGAFPSSYEALRQLAGIGDYTAAAVASIAFGEPRVVVDGNVLRVVARVTNDPADIRSPRTRERFRQAAQGWMGKQDPGTLNQALMELGATVCVPRIPSCGVCPVAAHCLARVAGTAAQLPVKLRDTRKVHIEEELLVVERSGSILLRLKGAGEGRMAGFWHLPAAPELSGVRRKSTAGTFRHTITHHHYVISVTLAALPRTAAPAGFDWVAPQRLSALPLSTTARKALRLAGVI